MVELYWLVVGLVIGLVAGFNSRPFYERWRAEQALEKAKLASREKRSASAKEAAERRKIRAGSTAGQATSINGSGASYQPRDTEQQS